MNGEDVQNVLNWAGANPIPALIVVIALAIIVPIPFLYILSKIIASVSNQTPFFNLLQNELQQISKDIRDTSKEQVHAIREIPKDLTLAVITAMGDLDKHLTLQDKQIETEGKKIELVLQNVNRMQSEIHDLSTRLSECLKTGDLEPLQNDILILKGDLGIVVQWIKTQQEQTS